MKILILGGTGMLGHKLWQVLNAHSPSWVTIRKSFDDVARLQMFDEARTVTKVSADRFESVSASISMVKPDVVVNCIGIVKQAVVAKDPIPSITVNALFPQLLAEHCRANKIRLIQISTDCVFSGTKGNYHETDTPDATDLYGRTKLLGEVSAPGCLTLRTSMIGRELGTSHGLIEWFLSQKEKAVRGFRKAIFSGLTTPELARVIYRVATKLPTLEGIHHVAAKPISKHELLGLVNEAYHADITIVPDDSFLCDRSLDCSGFTKLTGIVIPHWPEMIDTMANDPTPYPSFRRS